MMRNRDGITGPCRAAGEARRLAAALLFFLVAGGCGGGEESAETAWEIDRSVTRGPAVFRVAVDRESVTIADRLQLMLEARVDAGWEAELPRFGDKLDRFGIVDYRSPGPVLESDGSVVSRRIYELEPFLSGTYRIPPMALTFFREGDTLAHVLESDTIVVTVGSLLPDSARLTAQEAGRWAIRDIAGPVSFPPDRRPLWIVLGILLAACVVAAIVIRRRRRPAPAPPVPAHEIAFRRLEELLSSGMTDEGRYAEFTAAVADVLRRYIEDRFGLRAPEMTTEEFLAAAGRGADVRLPRAGILSEFLRHVDLVKFATLEPSAGDVARTFEICRDFIEETGEEVKAAAETAAAAS